MNLVNTSPCALVRNRSSNAKSTDDWRVEGFKTVRCLVSWKKSINESVKIVVSTVDCSKTSLMLRCVRKLSTILNMIIIYCCVLIYNIILRYARVQKLTKNRCSTWWCYIVKYALFKHRHLMTAGCKVEFIFHFVYHYRCSCYITTFFPIYLKNHRSSIFKWKLYWYFYLFLYNHFWNRRGHTNIIHSTQLYGVIRYNGSA